MLSLNNLILTTFLVISCLATCVRADPTSDIISCHEDGGWIPCLHKQPGKGIRVEPDSLAFPVTHQAEDVHFALRRSSSILSRVTAFGVIVQRGVSATLNYNLTINAITSERINALTQSLVTTLNNLELEILNALLPNYNNGLSVPVLHLLGINFGGTTNRQSQILASRLITRYNRLSETLQEILESIEEERIVIAGSLSATGVSEDPVVSYVFIRTATVVFNDGSSRLVVTSDPEETEAATISGDILPSSEKHLYTGPVN